MTVRELIEELLKVKPELEARVWDLGWGDHVPVNTVSVYNNHVILEALPPLDPDDKEA